LWHSLSKPTREEGGPASGGQKGGWLTPPFPTLRLMSFLILSSNKGGGVGSPGCWTLLQEVGSPGLEPPRGLDAVGGGLRGGFSDTTCDPRPAARAGRLNIWLPSTTTARPFRTAGRDWNHGAVWSTGSGRARWEPWGCALWIPSPPPTPTSETNEGKTPPLRLSFASARALVPSSCRVRSMSKTGRAVSPSLDGYRGMVKM